MSSQEEFYKAVLGPKNQDYYLNQFAKFDTNGKAGASWHWPAFFVTFYWFLYRKMWLNALLYFFLPYILMIVLGVVAAVMGNSAGVIVGLGYLIYFIVIFVVLPMYANALYYKQCKAKIAAVRASSNEEQRQLGELTGRGGTSNIILIIVLVMAFVAVIGILAAIAIPAYQQYTTRARMVEVVSVGHKATESVASYYYQHQQSPGSLAEAGFSAPLPPAVKEIAVSSQDGVVTLTLAAGPVNGKKLVFIPSFNAENKIVWQCMSQDIQEQFLPPECRQPK